jgi:negative regulator of flagellin synthesis FlgM
MRIEAYNQVAQIYGAQKTTAKAKANKTTSMGRDEVQISSFGKDLQVAKAAMKNSAEVRADKVADLKQRIESGNYNVDMDDFASVLLSKFGK